MIIGTKYILHPTFVLVLRLIFNPRGYVLGSVYFYCLFFQHDVKTVFMKSVGMV